jgi:hypothetical protein
MLVRKPHAGHPDFFVSAKTAAPVPARHQALREALVRASLDPAVRSITHVQAAHVEAAPLDVDFVVVERPDGRFRLDVVPARRVHDGIEDSAFQIAMIRLDLAPIVVTAEDLRAEPGRSNRDLVWSHRGRAVSVDQRLQILRLLADDGPMALDALLASVTGRDPAAAVMALACDDLLELDLESGPIGPSTVVRART